MTPPSPARPFTATPSTGGGLRVREQLRLLGNCEGDIAGMTAEEIIRALEGGVEPLTLAEVDDGVALSDEAAYAAGGRVR